MRAKVARHGRGARYDAACWVASASILLAGASSAAADRALGEYLSAECVTCHQVSGAENGIPAIVGWPEAGFVEIMKLYRQKQRDNPVMQTIAGGLSDDDIAALASYFGGLRQKAGK